MLLPVCSCRDIVHVQAADVGNAGTVEPEIPVPVQPEIPVPVQPEIPAPAEPEVQAEALIMRLREIIGTVSLKDEDGEAYDVEENMRLFSDSTLGTKSESSAVVDLDEEW